MSAIECRYRVSSALMAAAIRAGAEGKGRKPRPGWWPGFMAGLCIAGGLTLAVLLQGSGVEVPWQPILGFGLGAATVLGVWQLTYSRQLRRIMAEHDAAAAAAGEIVSRFGPEGIETRTALGQSFNHWGGVGAVHEIPGGTAVQMGLMTMPVPDSALPRGMTGRVFRAALDGWRGPA
ncbi:hypothetical protein [Vannielia litorea]|uniref:Uncharacterized protein n=1 Tax=Vannielia litorea TaxID=1217970 RepID=A0A1N6HPJ4_9RHOB|nr:hypothetical protein [Vannielia litorea]SIO21734.1 hypothetical protein SAMN05444002_3575 [Vannielia litorea]